jgi:anthranilate synthase component 2
LVADAWTADGEIMAVHHKTRPVFGVQFHPESIKTQYGHELIQNFLKLT